MQEGECKSSACEREARTGFRPIGEVSRTSSQPPPPPPNIAPPSAPARRSCDMRSRKLPSFAETAGMVANPTGGPTTAAAAVPVPILK